MLWYYFLSCFFIIDFILMLPFSFRKMWLIVWRKLPHLVRGLSGILVSMVPQVFQNFNFRIFSRKTISDKSLLDSQVLLHFFLSVVIWVFGFLYGILEISTRVSFKTFCTEKRMSWLSISLGRIFFLIQLLNPLLSFGRLLHIFCVKWITYRNIRD